MHCKYEVSENENGKDLFIFRQIMTSIEHA